MFDMSAVKYDSFNNRKTQECETVLTSQVLKLIRSGLGWSEGSGWSRVVQGGPGGQGGQGQDGQDGQDGHDG